MPNKSYMRVTDKGFNVRIQRLKNAIQHRVEVNVGVQGEAADTLHDLPPGSKAKQTRLVDIAAAHEFGTADNRPPQRSFLRATYDAHRDKYIGLLKKIETQFIQGKSSDGARIGKYKVFGEIARGDVLQRIKAHIPPALAESTLRQKRKGGTTPLIDFGQLINAISYEVKQK